MPALPRLIGLLASAVLVGCVAFPGVPPEGDRGGDREGGDADSIEIEVGSSSGIYGGPTFTERWVLRRTGECEGTTTTGRNAGNDPPTTERTKLRSEGAYRECGRLLRETGFFWMRDREPKVRFENSTEWIEARVGTRQHRVLVVSSAAPPPGYTRVREFVYGLGERAREVKP